MKTRGWMALGVIQVIILVIMAGCRGEPTVDEPSEAPVADEVVTPSPPPAAERPGVTILADGVLQAALPALPLAFETGGVLLTLNVQPGDQVGTGDLIATLDDAALQEGVTSAALQVAQSENNLAQVQLALDDLLAWEPNETAVALAEANLAAAEAVLAQVQSQEAMAGNNLTAVNVQIVQARRAVEDAQEAYDRAHDPARDWELNDRWRSDYLKAEREATARGVQAAQEALTVAYAQYNLTAAGLDNEVAMLNAQVSILSAQQALEQATAGPKESEIAAAQLRVELAELSWEQSLFNQAQADNALARARLIAPGGGTVLSVHLATGAMVGAGAPIVTLLDTDQLEFQTTNVTERDLAQIQAGLRAVVMLKAYPDQSIEAEVLRIGMQAGGAVGDAATFTVMLGLGETELDLRPGMTGRVEIHSGG